MDGTGKPGPLSLMDGLLSRNSVPPRLVDDSVPPQADIFDILAAAVRAPDHGAVRPWRFHVIAGAARERLGDVFVEALQQREPDVSVDAIEKERNRPLRAPLIIAVCAVVDPSRGEKVPVAEQLSSTASACQNILLAAHAKGYGAIWLTGKNTRDAHVKAAFGLSNDDSIVGFMYIGTPTGPVTQKTRPDARDFTTVW